MRSLMLFCQNFAMIVGTTTYTALVGRLAPGTPEGSRQSTIRTAGTFSLLWIRVTANATTGGTNTVRLRINSGNGTLVVNPGTGATGEFLDSTHSDAVIATDEVDTLFAVGSGGNMTVSAVNYVFDTGAQTAISLLGGTGGGAPDVVFASATRYVNFSGELGDDGDTTEANTQIEVNAVGTLKNLFLNVTANARTSTTTFGSRVNAATGNLAVSVGSGATGIFEDTSNSDTIAAGDKVNAYITTGAGSNILNYVPITVTFETTATGRFLFTYGRWTSSWVVAAGATGNVNCSGGPNDGTESNLRAQTNLYLVDTNLWCYVSANATTGASTLKRRVNGANGGQSVTIGSGATGEFQDSSGFDNVAPTDEINWQLVNGGGGSLSVKAISSVANARTRASACCV